MLDGLRTRWTLWVTWRDEQGRPWSDFARFDRMDDARQAHADMVVKHRDGLGGRGVRDRVQVHQVAKETRSPEGHWTPAGWDAGTGDVRIRWDAA